MRLEQSSDLKLLKAGKSALDAVLYAGTFGTIFAPLLAGIVTREPGFLCLYGLTPIELLALNRIVVDRNILEKQIMMREMRPRKT